MLLIQILAISQVISTNMMALLMSSTLIKNGLIMNQMAMKIQFIHLHMQIMKQQLPMIRQVVLVGHSFII